MCEKRSFSRAKKGFFIFGTVFDQVQNPARVIIGRCLIQNLNWCRVGRPGRPPGAALLVHSSLRSLGPLDGGAEMVVQSLLEALGPQGTLLMPALSYRTVGPQSPVFNVTTTPSCVGALPEYFRTRPGTLRSVHPTHSASGLGPQAQDLLGEHIRSTTPCGPYSHSPGCLRQAGKSFSSGAASSQYLDARRRRTRRTGIPVRRRSRLPGHPGRWQPRAHARAQPRF